MTTTELKDLGQRIDSCMARHGITVEILERRRSAERLHILTVRLTVDAQQFSRAIEQMRAEMIKFGEAWQRAIGRDIHHD